jgi:lambda repressor-like predicted transcriptional regulator
MSDQRQRKKIVARVHEQSTELSALTAAAGLATLAYLLDMTAMEAERLLRDKGKA